MNDFENFFWRESDRCIHKWSNYFKFYDKYFQKYKNRPIKLLEIGVNEGGSLQMWQSYFNKSSLIVGMDINPNCIGCGDYNIKIFIGDQSNVNDLEKMVNEYGTFDIIIDDGSHVHSHQTFTFEYLYDYLNAGGTYLVEDTHTSYWSDWKQTNETFMEYSKRIVDDLTAYHKYDDKFVTKYTRTLAGIYFHDSMVFFEKSEKLIEKPNVFYSVGMRYNKK